MSEAVQNFNAWANRYRDFLVAPFQVVGQRQELENSFDAFLDTLPEVLKPLVSEIESNGLDSTPIWEILGNPYLEIRELEKLLDKVWSTVRRLEFKQDPKPAKPKRSRVQPDHEVTVWFRKHGHKYANRAEAVRQFLTIPSDTMRKSESMYKSLYNRLSKDLDKRPLKTPKSKRKIR